MFFDFSSDKCPLSPKLCTYLALVSQRLSKCKLPSDMQKFCQSVRDEYVLYSFVPLMIIWMISNKFHAIRLPNTMKPNNLKPGVASPRELNDMNKLKTRLQVAGKIKCFLECVLLQGLYV